MLPCLPVTAKALSSPSPAPRPLVLAAVLAAASLMLAVTGYSFGGGNHEVYLLEPLRRAGLASFGADWFVHDTLQYHGLFAAVAATLLRYDVARGGFLVLFLFLLLATAGAWWRLVRALGGGVTAYLVAVVGYHLLLGDRGLGMYSLLQDGQFNAGNVAAVALLVGIVLWVEGRAVWAGVAFGVAGAFHLNYAVVAPVLWVALVAWNVIPKAGPQRGSGPGSGASTEPDLSRVAARLSERVLLATALALVPSLANVALALPSKLREEGTMPLPRFIELYVRLRHPHHYDPTAWPWWVWAAFLLPVPFAARAFSDSRAATPPRSGVGDDTEPGPGRRCRPAVRRAAHVWFLLMALQAFALLTAGLFWLGPTFVQLSLWRFSPHAKLLAVSAVAAWLVTPRLSPDADEHIVLLPPRPTPVKANREQLVAAGFLLTAFALIGIVVLAAIFSLRFRASVESTDNISVWQLVFGLMVVLVTMFAAAFRSPGVIRRSPLRTAKPVGHLLDWVNSLLSVAPIGLIGFFLLQSAWRGEMPPPGQPAPDAAVLDAAEWAKWNAPRDALFLLPPDASAFSVNARRGQVVSFKLVPQLAGELAEWDRRLRDVLDVPDLSVYAGGFTGYRTAQQRMRERYDALPTQHLFKVARQYGARYVFRSAADPAADAPVAWRGTGGAVLYDLGQPQ